MQTLINDYDPFPGYNLLAGDMNELFYYSNKGNAPQKIKPGIHGVSNHLLNTDWPKVAKGKFGMSNIISKEKENMMEELFNLLQHAENFTRSSPAKYRGYSRMGTNAFSHVHQKQRLWNKKFYGIINDR